MIGASSKKEFSSCDGLLPSSNTPDTWQIGDTLLPLSSTPDAWQTAEPITKISESIYPFDENRIRPSSKEVRRYVNVCNKV